MGRDVQEIINDMNYALFECGCTLNVRFRNGELIIIEPVKDYVIVWDKYDKNLGAYLNMYDLLTKLRINHKQFMYLLEDIVSY